MSRTSSGWSARLQQRWHALLPRQQRIFGGSALVLAFGLLLAYVWMPAVRERDRLLVRLPQLKMQLEQMQDQADEIGRLKSAPPVVATSAAVADVPALQNIFGESARVTVDANRALRVVIPKMAYAAWWDRIADIQSRYRLQIAALTLQSLPGGRHDVSVDMLLSDRLSAAPVETSKK